MEWLSLLEKCFWSGLAALGFSVLFNVPRRTLLAIFLMGAAGGGTKLLVMQWGVNIVLASLAGASVIGLVSIAAAYTNAAPLVFSLPAVIPMVPGTYAYRMMIGLVKLAGNLPLDTYTQVLAETVNYGLKVMLILICLAVGVALPMLLTRKEAPRNMRNRTFDEVDVVE
jgi:uncharacterized membrane protein YjjB (DUF3815 family)